MGRKDTLTKEYLRNPEVFADAFNQFLYRGRQGIDPGRLRELDAAEIAVPYGAGDAGVPQQRYRDVLKLLTVMTDGETAFCILGIEAQSAVHYAMPVRNGLYDFLQLARQVTETAKSHKKEAKYGSGENLTSEGKLTSGEYLSGFHKSDKLLPVVTLVVYFSAEEWDAPLTLREMYACGDADILSYAADYRVNLLAPQKLGDEEISLFRSSLREVMLYIKYSGDQKKMDEIMDKNERFEQMDREAAEVINAVTDSKLKFEEEEDTVNMCLAIRQMREESRTEGRLEGQLEGRLEGRQEGELRKMISLVCRKMAKGKNAEVIADDLEEDIGEIKRIYDAAVKYAPDYDTEKIYTELCV